MLVRDKLKTLPPHFASVFITECSCGTLLEWTSDNKIKCPNPSCNSSLSKRLEHFFKVLGCAEFGESNCSKLADIVDNIYEVIDLPIDKYPFGAKTKVKLFAELHGDKAASVMAEASAKDLMVALGITLELTDEDESIFTRLKTERFNSHELSDWISDIYNRAGLEAKLEGIHGKKEVPLWRAIQALGIKGIADTSKKLFMKYTSYQDFLDEMQAQGSDENMMYWLTDKLGYKTIGERAYQCVDSLAIHRDEIFELEPRMAITPAKSVQIKIAISGDVDGFSDKQAFLDYVNQYNTDFEFILNSTVSKEVAFLVTDLIKSGNIEKAAKYGKMKFSCEEFAGYCQDGTILQVVGLEV